MTGGRTDLDRAVAVLGLLALAAAAVGGWVDLRFRGWGLAVTLVLGLVAVAAGWLGRRLGGVRVAGRMVDRPVGLAAGLGFLAAAVVQIVQLGGAAGDVEHGVLGGNAGTFAVWLGLGVGLAVLGLTPDTPDAKPSTT